MQNHSMRSRRRGATATPQRPPHVLCALMLVAACPLLPRVQAREIVSSKCYVKVRRRAAARMGSGNLLADRSDLPGAPNVALA